MLPGSNNVCFVYSSAETIPGLPSVLALNSTILCINTVLPCPVDQKTSDLNTFSSTCEVVFHFQPSLCVAFVITVHNMVKSEQTPAGR